MIMDKDGSGTGKAPTRFQRALSVISIVLSAPVSWLGLVGLFLVSGSLILGESRDRLDFWFAHIFLALVSALLIYVGYRIASAARRARRSSGEAPIASTAPALQVQSMPFRRDRALLSIFALAGAYALLRSCDLFECHFPEANSGQAFLLILATFGAFTLAGVFAVQALSGLTLRGLRSAWRAPVSMRRGLLGFLIVVAFMSIAIAVEQVFVRQGVIGPRKYSAPPPRSAIEQPVLRAS